MAAFYTQDWTTGTFSIPQVYPSDFNSSDFSGGSDTPITGYPTLAAAENIETVAAAGPTGENVIDAIDTDSYSLAGVQLGALGSLASGQYDARGLTVTWWMKLKSSAFAEQDGYDIFTLSHGGTSGSDGDKLRTQAGVFFQLYGYQLSGVTFDYAIAYRSFGSGQANDFPEVYGGSGFGDQVFTADDAWHEFKVVLRPATVTGAFAGNGFKGTATVAADGGFDLFVDNALVMSHDGLTFVVNHLATTTPEVYYGWGLWFGYAELPGPVTLISMSNGTDVEVIDNSGTVCCSVGGEGEVPAGGGTGNGASPVQYPSIGTQIECAGAGLVPTQADLTYSETWWGF